MKHLWTGGLLVIVAAGLIALGIGVDRLLLTKMAGDPLAFAGSVFGAAAAVFGSAYIGRWQADATRRERYRILIDAFDEAISCAAKLETIGRSALPRPPAQTALNEYRRGMVWLHRIAKAAVPDSVPMLKAADALKRMSPTDYVRMSQAVTSADMYPNERTDLGQRAADVMASLKAARAHLVR